MKGDGPGKSRKLVQDAHTGAFYFESNLEALERGIRDRDKRITALNRGEQAKCDFIKNQAQGHYHLFEMKDSRERHALKENMKNFIAHKKILDYVERIRDSDRVYNENFGTYGPRTSMQELQPMIDIERKRLEPMVRRKVQALLLLQQRRPMMEMDRRLTTPALMQSWRRRSLSSIQLPAGTPLMQRPYRPARVGLSLPPIQAARRPTGALSGVASAPANTRTAHDAGGPSVFVTEKSFHQ